MLVALQPLLRQPFHYLVEINVTVNKLYMEMAGENVTRL